MKKQEEEKEAEAKKEQETPSGAIEVISEPEQDDEANMSTAEKRKRRR